MSGLAVPTPRMHEIYHRLSIIYHRLSVAVLMRLAGRCCLPTRGDLSDDNDPSSPHGWRMTLFATMNSPGIGQHADLTFVILLATLTTFLFYKLRYGRLVTNLVITEARAAMTRDIGKVVTARVRQPNGTIVDLMGRVEAVDATGLYLGCGQETAVVAWVTLVEIHSE